MVTEREKERIGRLMEELRAFMEDEGEAGSSPRIERQVTDLVQALYFRLDQLRSATGARAKGPARPRERLADALRRALAGLAAVPEDEDVVTEEIAKDFETVLDLFDLSRIARIRGETEAIKFKRGK